MGEYDSRGYLRLINPCEKIVEARAESTDLIDNIHIDFKNIERACVFHILEKNTRTNLSHVVDPFFYILRKEAIHTL